VATAELAKVLMVKAGAASEEETGTAADEYAADEEAADDAATEEAEAAEAAEEYAAGDDAEEDAAEDAAEVAASEPTLLGPVGVSPALTHPVFAVNAAGQVTFWKLTAGLSAPSNQPKRKLHPG